MAGRKLDPDKHEIAWFPEDNAYRRVTRRVEKGEIGGQEIAVEVTEVGDKVQWIDEAPDNVEDGSGHFRTFEGEDAEYRATVSNVGPTPAETQEG